MLTDLADDYRRVRGELERSILPLASLVDGRQFSFQASLHGLQFRRADVPTSWAVRGNSWVLTQIVCVGPTSAGR